MSSNKIRNQKSVESSVKSNEMNENTCVVCFKNVEIFSIGECDHPVCAECSTRMRVLCRQNECPICRQELQKVIFTNEILPYRQLETNNRSGLYDKKYRICFASLKIQNEFYTLLDNPCPKCDIPPFHSFDALKTHVRKSHELFYCDLCTEHLKIFSFERRCYTRHDLGVHRRKGDPDNTSHRGHPLCKYCDCRYLDSDELFRHLRREHYYCHFCDADGANYFYGDYDSLREHFRNEHYLCEEGECAKEEFTAVFRTDIDLKAHKASTHGKLLGKAGTKQARTLEFEFTLAPRPNRQMNFGNDSGPRGGSSRFRHDPQMEFELEERDTIIQQPQKIIDHKNEMEFPSLGGTSSNNTSTSVTVTKPQVSLKTKAYGIGKSGLARTNENFPALGRENPVHDPGPSLNFKTSSLLKNTSTITTTTSSSLNNTHNKQSESSQKYSENRTKSMVVNNTTSSTTSKRPSESHKQINKKVEDFPALPGSSNKHKYLDLAEPAIPTNLINSVSSKHKPLMADNFLSVATSVAPKINLIKSTTEESQQTISGKKSNPTQSTNKPPPKLNSQDNFPALAPISGDMKSLQAQWVTPKQKVEPKKNKINPAPDLSNNKNNEDKKKDKKSGKSSKENNNSNSKKNEINNNHHSMNDRKLSELNFDSTKLDEFPSLLPNSKTSTIQTSLNNKKNKKNSNINSVTLNSVARPQNNLTFTTSLGESFNIVPTYHYKPPTNDKNRNLNLHTSFQQVLSPEVMSEFRQISKMFREGTYKAQPYYEHCIIALGEKFDDLFPELLVLLPDINKQQELYLVHSQYTKDTSKGNKKNRSGMKGAKLEVCSTCKQVLMSNDLLPHIQLHTLEKNFPILDEYQENSQQQV